MKTKRRAIVMNPADNVATSLEPLGAGERITLDVEGVVRDFDIFSDIPMGHKFALIDMAEGQEVIKYGEPIGQSTRRIARGEHVHTHNLTSKTRGASG